MKKAGSFTEEVNLVNPEAFDPDGGDPFPIEEFIHMCETGALIDYDGFAEEILLDKKVILNNKVSPSEALRTKKQLRDLNARFDNKLEIVWYNR